MGIQAPAKVKFEIIKSTLENDNNLLCIKELCMIACVSKSGYYNWINSASKRQEREEQDENDFELVLDAYSYRYVKGARGIYMRLLHCEIVMNLKKIRRLMAKYGLICPIRRENAYRKMVRETRTNKVASNIVAREFESRGVRKVLLTDITYIFYGVSVCYLSTIIDACTKEVLGYELSEDLKVEFVLRTIDQLVNEHGSVLDEETIVHSDQGCHYTSNAFIERLKDEKFVQSMSRKGNCWDNAPQESFFGHMKDEIKYEVSKCKSYEEVKAIIDDWMDYYNNERYQWDLLKLSPKGYYEYVTTGTYPIKNRNPKRTTDGFIA